MDYTPDFTDKKILFTAFSVVDGSEEKAAYDYVKSHGANNLHCFYWGGDEIAAQIPADVTATEIDGVNDFDPKLTEGYDLVFRHTSTRPDKIRSPVTSGTAEFFKVCPAPIIGITGTKGKGTCATLTRNILVESGETVHLLGNIGTTALSELSNITENDIVVFEISSFQLWDLEHSPQTAVVLTMAEDHQDVHASLQEYVDAKKHIVLNQNEQDVVIFHPTNTLSTEIATAGKSQKKRYLTPDGAYLEEGMVMFEGVEILAIDEVGLIGAHNLENITAAITAAWEYSQNVEATKKAVAEFKGLEHRLEPCGEIGGVRYFNDSFSVATPATVAALKAFSEPVVAIVGGYDRGISMDPIVEAIIGEDTAWVVLVGETGPAIAKKLDAHAYDRYQLLETHDMGEMVRMARNHAAGGSVVVLSPGCASFDMFDNYKQRGALFKQAIQQLHDK